MGEPRPGTRNKKEDPGTGTGTGTVDSRDPEAFVSTCPYSASHQIILPAVSIITHEGIHVFIAADI